MRYILALLALGLAAGEAPAAEALGRLFFTPAERARLDAARSEKSWVPVASEQEEAPPIPELVTYGGLVRRSDGKTTVWINNRPVNDGKATERLPVKTRVQPDGSVVLEVPQASRSVNLKVGQSLEIVSGTIEEPYARGPIIATPPPKPAAAGGSRAASTAEGASPRPPSARKDQNDDDQDRR